MAGAVVVGTVVVVRGIGEVVVGDMAGAVVVTGALVTTAVVAGALVTAADLGVVGSDPPEQASVLGRVIPTMIIAKMTLLVALIITRKL